MAELAGLKSESSDCTAGRKKFSCPNNYNNTVGTKRMGCNLNNQGSEF